MSAIRIEPGFLAMTGEMVDAAILGMLVKRAQEYGTKEAGRIKIKTIADSCGIEESEACRRLRHLRLLVVMDGEEIMPGKMLGVANLSIGVTVVDGEQPELPMEELPRAKTGLPPIRKPNRLHVLDRDDLTVGDETYRGSIVPEYATESSDEYLRCRLSYWRIDDAGIGWEAKVLGKVFEGASCVVDAWLWFEEAVGWRPGILEWCDDKHTLVRPLKLDDATFGALIGALRDKHPDESAVYDAALSSGVLTIQQREGGDRIQFKRDGKKGLHWPGVEALQTAATDGEAA